MKQDDLKFFFGNRYELFSDVTKKKMDQTDDLNKIHQLSLTDDFYKDALNLMEVENVNEKVY